jgi:uncharacterized protein (TIGR02466 family)
MYFHSSFPTLIGNSELNSISDQDLFQFKECIEDFGYVEVGVKSSLLIHRYTKEQRILDHPIFKILKQEILQNSKKYLDKLSIPYQDLQISNSWGVKFDKEEYGNKHAHFNSLISGVYYLTEGAQIRFYDPLDDKWFYQSGIEKHITFTSSINSLLFFPSFLYHEVAKSEKDNRYSIAFNIIPKGEFSTETQKLYL